jgi:hypothetical protein
MANVRYRYGIVHLVLAWAAHTALIVLAGKIGFRQGITLVAKSGIATNVAEKHRQQRTKLWKGLKLSQSGFSLILSLGFGIGGAASIDTWLTFSLQYGDLLLAIGAIAISVGQMAVMYAVARKIAIGKYGQWSWPSLRSGV